MTDKKVFVTSTNLSVSTAMLLAAEGVAVTYRPETGDVYLTNEGGKHEQGCKQAS